MAEVYPEVPLRDVRGRRTLLSIEKARRELGYSPKHSWRENI
jgi:nucleoside-diphosphate-sugar epimerase